MPESERKSQVRPLNSNTSAGLVVMKAMPQAKNRITVVRTAVARFESTPVTPTLASTAVTPANNAESNDQWTQFMRRLWPIGPVNQRPRHGSFGKPWRSATR